MFKFYIIELIIYMNKNKKKYLIKLNTSAFKNNNSKSFN